MNTDGTIYPTACKQDYIPEVSADSSTEASKLPVTGPTKPQSFTESIWEN